VILIHQNRHMLSAMAQCYLPLHSHKPRCSLYPLALFSSVLITLKLLLPELLSLMHYLFIQHFVCLRTSSAHHNLNILCHSLCIPWLIVCTSKCLSAYSNILSATQNNPYMHRIPHSQTHGCLFATWKPDHSIFE